MALDQIQPMQKVIRGLIERFCLQPTEQKNEEQRA
jgi:acetylornithine deacetylase